MGTDYQHFSAEERATIIILLQQGGSARSIVRTLRRLPPTITRKIRRALQWPQRAALVPTGSNSTRDARAASARPPCEAAGSSGAAPSCAQMGCASGGHHILPESCSLGENC